MSTYRTKAIAIARRAFHENNRVYILYSEDFGKIEAVARGSRKILSKLAPHLEPPVLVEIMVARGKRIDKLAGALSINSYPKIRLEFRKIETILTCFKTLDSLTYLNQKDRKVWGLLEKFLEICENLEQVEFDRRADVLINAFLIKLLAFLGYKPEIKKCVLCKKDSPKIIYFDYIKGGLVCDTCQRRLFYNSCIKVDKSSVEELSNLLSKRFEEILKSSFQISNTTKEIIQLLIKNQTQP